MDDHKHGCEERDCCDTRSCQHHDTYCTNVVNLLALDVSFTKDAERWIDSYINHTATALAKRARAASNGHAPVELNTC